MSNEGIKPWTEKGLVVYILGIRKFSVAYIVNGLTGFKCHHKDGGTYGLTGYKCRHKYGGNHGLMGCKI